MADIVSKNTVLYEIEFKKNFNKVFLKCRKNWKTGTARPHKTKLRRSVLLIIILFGVIFLKAI